MHRTMTMHRIKVKTVQEVPEEGHTHSNLLINFEKACLRNQVLLKDLELAKARLRTLAAYTPTEEELEQLSSAYRSRLQKRSNA